MSGPYRYSARSLAVRMDLHADLRLVFDAVLRGYDHTLLEGHRGEERQEQLHREGKTTLHWPDSKHNRIPAVAVDAVPYPIQWTAEEPEDTPLVRARFYHFAGYVFRVADELDVALRWGGDWDGDRTFTDQSFHDLPHFEIIDPREL